MKGSKGGFEFLIFDYSHYKYKGQYNATILNITSPELAFPLFAMPWKFLYPHLVPASEKNGRSVSRDEYKNEYNGGEEGNILKNKIFINENLYSELDSFFCANRRYQVEAGGDNFLYKW